MAKQSKTNLEKHTDKACIKFANWLLTNTCMTYRGGRTDLWIPIRQYRVGAAYSSAKIYKLFRQKERK